VTAISRIGQYAARVNIGKDDLLIAVRAYLDGSGNLGMNYLTLAAVATTDEIWGPFETEWNDILKNHSPQAKYVHMREAYWLVEGFDFKLGWTTDNAFQLANKCLALMSWQDKLKFRMFYCAIDLVAHRKLLAEGYVIPNPADLCNTYCSRSVLGWLLKHFPDKVNYFTDTVKYFFDRNECFETSFKEEWNREKNLAEQNKKWSPWQMIEEVASVEMKKTPGIQAADVIAWAVNRENTKKEGDLAWRMAEIIRTVIPAIFIVWDEQKMREHFRPLTLL
jgi:Protein of unknown function (DUF3800)